MYNMPPNTILCLLWNFVNNSEVLAFAGCFQTMDNIIHNADTHLGTLRFAHLPVGSFLALLSKDEAIKPFHTHVEIGVRAYKLFELQGGKVKLSKAVASLNMMQGKGKADIHILELPKDNCVE
jgi:hypothetical protein